MADPRFKRQLRAELIARDGMRCHWCRDMTFITIDPNRLDACTLDHLLPKSQGGTLRLDNLVALAARECNENRGHMAPEEWARCFGRRA